MRNGFTHRAPRAQARGPRPVIPAGLARRMASMAIDNAVFGRAWALSPANEADWDALYANQLPRVYNFFRYRVGDGPVAEDLTSATFEKAWTARHRYRRGPAGFPTLLPHLARDLGAGPLPRGRALAPPRARAPLSRSETPHG